jgi:hypothetical protein
MILKTIFENTQFNHNSISNAYSITNKSQESIIEIQKLLKSTSNEETINSLKSAIIELEKAPLLLNRYAESSDSEFLIGDGLLFADLSNTVYNALDCVFNYFPHK